MSFAFRGSRGDIESGFSEYVPERTSTRVHPSRSVNNSSVYFLTSVILLFMVLHTPQMLHDFFFRWIILAVFVMLTSLRMYALCQQIQEHVRAHAAAASGVLGHAELRFDMPPSIAIASRGRLQGVRLQLALLDQEFDEEIDYEALRAIHFGNGSRTVSMTDEEINALPVHKYKVPGSTKDGSTDLTPSSTEAAEMEQDSKGEEGSATGPEDELTCTICLDQVMRGEIVRTLPCMHQYHANCIDPWLRLKGTCPVCKYCAVLGRQRNTENESEDSDVV